MKQSFAVIILGGTGQVGGAVVAELLATSACREVVMVTRKPIAPRSRVRNVVLDTGAADFAERTAALARDVLSQGPVSAVSCVGVGPDRGAGAKKNCNDLSSASSVPLRVAAICQSRSFVCFLRKHSAQPVSLCASNGHEGRHLAQRRFCPPRHISSRHHCGQRSHPGLGRLVGKPCAWVVWQY